MFKFSPTAEPSSAVDNDNTVYDWDWRANMIYYLKHLEHREGKTRGDKFEVLKYVVCCTCRLVFGMFLSRMRTWVHTHLAFFPQCLCLCATMKSTFCLTEHSKHLQTAFCDFQGWIFVVGLQRKQDTKTIECYLRMLANKISTEGMSLLYLKVDCIF